MNPVDLQDTENQSLDGFAQVPATFESADGVGASESSSSTTSTPSGEAGAAQISIQPDSAPSAPAEAPNEEVSAPPATSNAKEKPKIQTPLPELGPLPARLDRLRSRINEDPHELQSWDTFINEFTRLAATDERYEELRNVYDRLFFYFPYAVAQWISLLTLEISRKDHSRVSTLFAKCLRTVHAFDVFKLYLNYIRRTHSVLPDVDQGRAIIKQAYEWVLGRVLHHKESGPIFSDFISFYKGLQVNSAFEEQQKNEEIRKLYQRAISLPIVNVENLWREWDMWENGVNNKISAKKLLQDKSPTYLTARAALKTLRTLYEPLDRAVPVTHMPTFSNSEKNLVAKWHKIIEWEKSNPLKLDDQSVLFERVSWTFWQALNCLCRFPELWFDFATYAGTMGKSDKAISILKAGCEVCRGSFLLHFALADIYEGKEDYEKCKAAYESIVGYWSDEVDRLSEINERAKLNESSNDPPTKRIKRNHAGGDDANDSEDEEPQVTRKDQAVQDAKEALGLCWITYMRYSARSQGIKEMRSVFKRARNIQYCTWQVMIASALLEYHRNADTNVTQKLFKFACQSFPENVEPILIFSDWLLGVRDMTNLTSTLITGLKSNKLSKRSKRRIAEKLADIHALTADLSTIQTHEKLMNESFNVRAIDHARTRYKFLDLDLISVKELGIPPTRSCITLGPSGTDLNSSNVGGRQPSDAFKAAARVSSPAPADQQREKDRPFVEPKPKEAPAPPQEGPIEAIARLLCSLPPPDAFTGPFLDITGAMSLLNGAVPLRTPPNYVAAPAGGVISDPRRRKR